MAMFLITAAVITMHTHHFQASKTKRPAHAAVPAVTKASSEFDQSGLFNQVPADSRKAVAEAFAAIKPNLDYLIDRVLAIPALGAIINPRWTRSAPSLLPWRQLSLSARGERSLFE
jgi:hypothetical protein